MLHHQRKERIFYDLKSRLLVFFKIWKTSMPFGWYVIVDNFSLAKCALLKNLENTLQRKEDIHTST